MWDLAIDGETGDLMFSPTHDLLGASGEGVTRQRVLVRCKIPRGSWLYDETDTLGSNLYQISRYPSATQIAQAPNYVMEALEPMDDIQVDNVEVSQTDDNRLRVDVVYSMVKTEDGEDEDDGTLESGVLPDFDASVIV